MGVENMYVCSICGAKRPRSSFFRIHGDHVCKEHVFAARLVKSFLIEWRHEIVSQIEELLFCTGILVRGPIENRLRTIILQTYGKYLMDILEGKKSPSELPELYLDFRSLAERIKRLSNSYYSPEITRRLLNNLKELKGSLLTSSKIIKDDIGKSVLLLGTQEDVFRLSDEVIKKLFMIDPFNLARHVNATVGLFYYLTWISHTQRRGSIASRHLLAILETLYKAYNDKRVYTRYKCVLCGQIFNDEKSFLMHLENRHKTHSIAPRDAILYAISSDDFKRELRKSGLYHVVNKFDYYLSRLLISSIIWGAKRSELIINTKVLNVVKNVLHNTYYNVNLYRQSHS